MAEEQLEAYRARGADWRRQADSLRDMAESIETRAQLGDPERPTELKKAARYRKQADEAEKNAVAIEELIKKAE